MNIQRYKIIFAVCTAFCFSQAFAEKLIYVGTIDPIGVKVYSDADSVTHLGDTSTINNIAITDPYKPQYNDKMPFVFDCKAEILYFPDGKIQSISLPFEWEKRENLPGYQKFSMSSNTIINIYNTACKKWYEFWK